MRLPGLRPCRVGLVGGPVPAGELTSGVAALLALPLNISTQRVEAAHAALRTTAAFRQSRQRRLQHWLADSAAASSLTDGVAAERVQLNGGAVLAETVGALSDLSAAPGFAAAQASDGATAATATVAKADAGQNMGSVAAEVAQTVGLPQTQTRAAAERNQLVSGARPRLWVGPPHGLREEAPRLYRCSTGIFLGRRTLEGVTMLKWVIYEAVVP
jgi:hypothetical protein